MLHLLDNSNLFRVTIVTKNILINISLITSKTINKNSMYIRLFFDVDKKNIK